MAHIKLDLSETISVSDQQSGIMRKQVDVGQEDMVIARFWVQNFGLLEKTTFSAAERSKIEKVLYQLAEDMLSLRGDIMEYAAEVTRYFEGIKAGKFYEVKDNIEYFNEVFHGKKLVENFYFHAELCKRDAMRLFRIAVPQCSNYSWAKIYEFAKNNHGNYGRLAGFLQLHWENLGIIHQLRGVIEHGDEEKDFEITDIYLEKTDKGIAFHQPYFIYPETLKIKSISGEEKAESLKGVTVIDLMDKHFWAIFNTCEACAVFPLIATLDPKWQPKLISLQSMDKKCPIQWDTEPASNPRRTVNHPPV